MKKADNRQNVFLSNGIIKKKKRDLKRIKLMVDEKDRLQKEAQKLKFNKK